MGKILTQRRRTVSGWLSYWFFWGGAVQTGVIVVVVAVLSATTLSLATAAVAGCLVLSVGFIAATLRYLWETRRQELDTVGESQRRARRGAAVLASSAAPRVGVFLRGAKRPPLAGNYMWIAHEADGPQSPTVLLVPRRPSWLGAVVIPGPPLAQLPDFLDERGIGVLPLGSYSDRVWDRHLAELQRDLSKA